MKRLISIVLIICVLPFVSILSGCADYNLKKLKSDYYSITADAKHIAFRNNKLVIKYEDFLLDDGTKYMLENISKDGPYSNINVLNYALENSLSFVYSYVDICSSNKLKVDKTLKSKVGEDVRTLKKSITKLDELVASSAGSAQFYYNKNSQNTNYDDLYQLAKQYVVVINDVLAFSKDLQMVYNSGILQTNIDLNNVKYEEFDTNRVLNYIDYMRTTNKVDLTEVYVNSYLDNDTLLKSLKKSNSGTYPKLDINYNSYKNDIDRLSTTINSTTAKTKADNNKAEFLNGGVAMFNALRIVNNEYVKYEAVKDKLCFAEAKYSIEDKTQNLYIDIIKSYNEAVKNYSMAIEEVLDIIG